MKLNIAYSTDENYSKHAWVSICSLFDNNTDIEEIDVYIIDNEISKNTKNEFIKLAKQYNRNIIFVPFKSITYGLDDACPWQNSLSAYGRLFLGRLPNIEKIIYLDCDTVVLGSLKELWTLNINDYYLAGVQDTAGPSFRLNVGLKFDSRYINSGVALINLKKWRNDNIEKKFIQFINNFNGNVPCADQGTLNGVCKDNIFILHPKYNVMTPMYSFSAKQAAKFFEVENYYENEYVEEAKKMPIIIHYVGGFFIRPWFKNSDHPMKNIYLDYLDRSPWKGDLQAGGTLCKRTNNMKKAYEILPFNMFVATHRIVRFIKRLIRK